MWLLKKFAAVIITFTFVSIALIFFFYYLHSLSVPDEMEDINTNDLKSVVKVYSLTGGIKHIEANYESDAYFAIGYIQATDRMFQLDILRRTAKGELSEIFGREYLPFDKYMRTMNLSGISKNNKKVLHSHVLKLLQRFSDGINFYIEHNKKRLHFGFSALNYIPQPWKVEDCLLIQRLFAFQMSIGFKADINFGSIAEIIGVENTMRLIPDFEQNSIFVYDEFLIDSLPEKLTNNDEMLNKKEGENAFVRNFKYEFEKLNNVRFSNSITSYSSFGCNVWAMRKIQRENAEAILANDFHSEITIPSMWYQMQVSYPGTNFAGYALPGIPFVLSGRSNNISWGLANAMLDDCDYFIEKVDEQHDSYRVSSESLDKFNYKKDTIKIAKSEPYVYYLRATTRSPVISDFYSTKDIDFSDNFKKTKKADILKKYVMSYRWTGSLESDEMTPQYLLTKVNTWDAFKFVFKKWKSPGLNFVYADKSGNIGLLTAGAIPRRGSSNNLIIPNPGWLPEHDWFGLDTFGVIGTQFNPPKKYVSAANNPLMRKSNYSKYFDLSSRAKRIEELIQQYQTTDNYIVGTIDIQRMQTDILSDYSRVLMSIIQPVIKKNLNTLTDNEKQAYKLIRNWDFLQSSENQAPVIFNMLTMKLIENIFKPQLGSKAFSYYLDMPQFAMNKILEILKTYYPPNEDDSISIEEQTRIYTIMISFKQAIGTLAKIYKTSDIKKWKYGEFHKLTFKIPLNRNKFLEPVFSINDVQRSGSNTSVNYSSYNYFKPFNIGSSVSFRLIADLSESNLSYSLPGGISEDPINSHYTSQLHLWENGAYLKIPFSSKKIDDTHLTVILR